MSLLGEVGERYRRLQKYKLELSEAIVRYQAMIDEEQERLDTAMVYAADWGTYTATEVAMTAGYKSRAAIRDARKRIEKRESELR